MADGASRGIGAEGVSSRNAIASMASAYVVSFSKISSFVLRVLQMHILTSAQIMI